ncbi:hypothetical protein [Metaplanococcus flavidus]|uniref:Uncharacterized protein n=1 Tax=Metaplanococcus flavidus TaxID=569883 RepID=A0ABW3L9T7_9BACL
MRMADQKKILILGGTRHMIEIVKAVRRMGMSPIVVDDIIGAPAKGYADKSFSINIGDIEKLDKIIEEEKVNGVFSAFEGINAWHAIALCKKAGLPLFAANDQLGIMPDNEKFKEICKRFEVLIIERFEFTVEVEETTASAAWEFPALLKTI